MATAKTETKTAAPEVEIVGAAPEGNLPATQQDGQRPADNEDPQRGDAAPAKPAGRMATWEQFQTELRSRADEIGSQLPPNITREKFIGAALAAVKKTPDLLMAAPRTIFSSLIMAAQDGLLPDGREGIITVYNDRKLGPIAQWNPMFYGIRKRARELGGLIIDAQVVLKGDEFIYELGDTPRITHKPAPQAGEFVPATEATYTYAIFRQQIGTELIILHREVMTAAQVERTRKQSRAADSLMWTGFWTEGWRKTVGRRGSKSVPVSPELERIINRDDANFEFAGAGPAFPAGAYRQSLITERLNGGTKPEIVYTKSPPAASGDGKTSGGGNGGGEPKKAAADQMAGSSGDPKLPPNPDAGDMFSASAIDELAADLARAKTPEALNVLGDEWGPTVENLPPDWKAKAEVLITAKRASFNAAAG